MFPTPAYKEEYHQRRKDNDCRPNPTSSTSELLYLREVIMKEPSCQITKCSIKDGPDNTASRIVDKEGAPGHMVDTCQEGRPGAQNGNETSKEDGFVAIFLEKFSARSRWCGLRNR